MSTGAAGPGGAFGGVEYTDVAEARGPLLVVRGVTGVGWDESARIRMHSGEVRNGLVLEVDRDLAVVQMLEGTGGIQPGRHQRPLRRRDPARPRRAGLARPGLQRPGGAGRRRAADLRATARSGRGSPAQPPAPGVAVRADHHRGLGHRRAHHRGQGAEAAGVLGGGAAAPRARHPGRRPGHRGGRAVLGRLRGDGPDPPRRGRRAGRPRCPLGRGRAGPAAEHRRRPGGRADPHPTDRPHGRRAPRLRAGPARARGHGGHDVVRRGAAGGVRGPGRDPRASRLPRLSLQRPRLALRTLRPGPRAARLGHHRPGAHHAGRRHHPPGARPHGLHHRRARSCSRPTGRPPASTRRWSR